MAEAGLNRIAQRLAEVVGDSIEGAAQARHLQVGTKRIGVQGVANAKCPR